MECLTEASNTQGAASALRDRKPDLHTRLAHVRCAPSSRPQRNSPTRAPQPTHHPAVPAPRLTLRRAVQAQNESQRLTHALREEKQRADTAEARADKLVSCQPIVCACLPWFYNVPFLANTTLSSLSPLYRSPGGNVQPAEAQIHQLEALHPRDIRVSCSCCVPPTAGQARARATHRCCGRRESDSNLLLKCSSPEPDVEARVGKSQRTGGACASRATPSPPADLVTPVCRDNHIAERATPSPLLDNGTTPAGENAAPRPAQPPAPRFARTRLEPPSPVEQLAASPEEPVPQVTDDAETPTSAQAEEAENSSETGGEESAHDSDDELTRLAVTLSNGAGQHATNVQAQAEDDAEAASLALAMQLMQQEQALAQIYGGEHATGYGFGVEQEEEAGGADWIPAEEIEEVEVAEDALDESEATYEQLLELDEQKVVVGLSDQAKAGATKVVTLSAADVAALETLHDKRCCICLCDYEPADEVRQLPCDHGCHLDCMDQHLATSKFCPMCRTEVLTPRSSPTR